MFRSADDESDCSAYMAVSRPGEFACKLRLEQKFNSQSAKQKLEDRIVIAEEGSLGLVCNDDHGHGFKISSPGTSMLTRTLTSGSTVSSPADMRDEDVDAGTANNLEDRIVKFAKSTNVSASRCLASSTTCDKSLSTSCVSVTSNIEKRCSPRYSKLHESAIPVETSGASVCSGSQSSDSHCTSKSVAYSGLKFSFLTKDKEFSKKRKHTHCINSPSLESTILDESFGGGSEHKTEILHAWGSQIASISGSAQSEISDNEYLDCKRYKTKIQGSLEGPLGPGHLNLGCNHPVQKPIKEAFDYDLFSMGMENSRGLSSDPQLSFSQCGSLENDTIETEAEVPQQIECSGTSVEGRSLVINSVLELRMTSTSSYVLSSGRLTQDAVPESKSSTIDKDFEDYFSMLML
eukprot:TRINITY_DN9357_c0_g1_i2.p1 TRINITY_DN9357_c0_g1~~TRINITY_DN9357_c0_g1_i2.p1  ORF type:complete len:405 (-),score=70.77 TRINITY_DN9357_c0_g1_i2:275-1489(-)